MNAVMNLRVPQKARNFLISCTNKSFPMTLFHGVLKRGYDYVRGMDRADCDEEE
jgi:hypothetical protein